MITSSDASAEFATKTTIIVALGCLQLKNSGLALLQVVASAAASGRITSFRGEPRPVVPGGARCRSGSVALRGADRQPQKQGNRYRNRRREGRPDDRRCHVALE